MKKDTVVSIVGSFRKDPDALKNIYDRLILTHFVLSPASIDWTNPGDEFVKSTSEANKPIREIEENHLNAIRSSDFVVLFAPGGYIGLSGAFEIGFAHGLGIPVLSTEKLVDQTLEEMVDGIFDVDSVTIDYGRGLKVLQKQYARIAKQNGWHDESARDTMLLLTEEIGELARAVRKYEGLKRDSEFNVQLSEELADVQIYTAHLANIVGLDLGDAVSAKIVKNSKKKI